MESEQGKPSPPHCSAQPESLREIETHLHQEASRRERGILFGVEGRGKTGVCIEPTQ